MGQLCQATLTTQTNRQISTIKSISLRKLASNILLTTDYCLFLFFSFSTLLIQITTYYWKEEKKVSKTNRHILTKAWMVHTTNHSSISISVHPLKLTIWIWHLPWPTFSAIVYFRKSDSLVPFSLWKSSDHFGRV